MAVTIGELVGYLRLDETFSEALESPLEELNKFGELLPAAATQVGAFGEALQIPDSFAGVIAEAAAEIERHNAVMAEAAQVGQAFEQQLAASGITADQFAEHVVRTAAAMDSAHMEALKMNEALDASNKAAEQGSGIFGKLGDSIVQGMGIGVGIEIFGQLKDSISSAANAIPNMVGNLGRFAETIDNLHESTGISTKALQQWKFAGDIVGVSVEAMAMSVTRLNRSLDTMAPQVVESLRRIGLSAKDIKKMPEDMKVETIMSALGKLEAGADRSAIAMSLLGRSGSKLLPLATQFGSLKDAASALGIVLDQKVIKAAADFDDAGDKLGAVMVGLKNNFVSVIVQSEPMHLFMNGLVQLFGELSVWVQKNSKDLQGYVDFGIVFVASAMSNFIPVVEVVLSVIKALTDIWTVSMLTLKNFGSTLVAVGTIAKAVAMGDFKGAGDAMVQWTEDVKTNSDEAVASLKEHQEILSKTFEVTGKVKEKIDLLTNSIANATGKQHVATIEDDERKRALERTAEAAKKFTDAVTKMADSITQGGKDSKVLQAAIQEIGGVAALSNKQIEEFGGQLLASSIAGATLNTKSKEVVEAFIAMRTAISDSARKIAATDTLLGLLGKTMNETDFEIMQMESAFKLKLSAGIAMTSKQLEDFGKKMSALIPGASAAGQAIADNVLNRVEGLGVATSDTAEHFDKMFREAQNQSADVYEAMLPILAIMYQMDEAAVRAFTGGGVRELEDGLKKCKTEAEEFNDRLNMAQDGIGELANQIGGMGGQAISIFGTLGVGLAAISKETDAAEKSGKKLALAIVLVGAAGQMLSQSATPAVQKLGGALQGAASGAKIGGAILPGWGHAIGAVVGGIVGWIGAAKRLKAEMKAATDAFVEQQGGIDKLNEAAKAAGISIESIMHPKSIKQLKDDIELVKLKLDFAKEMGGMDAFKARVDAAGISITELFAAKNKETLLLAMDEVKLKLETWDQAQNDLNAAVEKYGFTIEELGPKFAQQKLDVVAADLLKSYKLLTAAGVDHNAIISRMGPDFTDYVDAAIASGTSIPMAMKSTIDAFYEAGQLIHANGDAFTEAEYQGLSFSQTMSEQFTSLMEKIEKLVDALLGFPSDINTNINTHYTSSGDVPSGHRSGDLEEDFGAGDYSPNSRIVEGDIPARSSSAAAGASFDDLAAKIGSQVAEAVSRISPAQMIMDERVVGEILQRRIDSGRLTGA